MSDETVTVPRSLLVRVREEVNGLRDEVERLTAERDQLLAQQGPETTTDEAIEGSWLHGKLVAQRDALAQQLEAAKNALSRLGTRAETDSVSVEEHARVVGERDELVREFEALRAEADDLRRAASQVPVLEETNRRLQADLHALQGTLGDVQADHARLIDTHPAPPTPMRAQPFVSGDGAPADSGAEAAVARAFVAWCQRGSALISRSYLFEAFLRETWDGADVRPVFRARTPEIRFTPGDGVEYWLVVAGDVRVVVPKPVSAYAFAELTPVYGGAATPDTLHSLTLAHADGDGAAFGLSHSGTVARG